MYGSNGDEDRWRRKRVPCQQGRWCKSYPVSCLLILRKRISCNITSHSSDCFPFPRIPSQCVNPILSQLDPSLRWWQIGSYIRVVKGTRGAYMLALLSPFCFLCWESWAVGVDRVKRPIWAQMGSWTCNPFFSLHPHHMQGEQQWENKPSLLWFLHSSALPHLRLTKHPSKKIQLHADPS